MGSRTISANGPWQEVPVRRICTFVQESIDEGTSWVVCELNSEDLWANFLSTVWRGGALEGTTPEEAFFDTCDRTPMSYDDIDNGRLICLVGIAPVKPAELVVFCSQQKTRKA